MLKTCRNYDYVLLLFNSNALIYVIKLLTHQKSEVYAYLVIPVESPLTLCVQCSTNVYSCPRVIRLYYHYDCGHYFHISEAICQAVDVLMTVGANG